MPKLAISNAVEFFYEDSGAPEPSDNYTTIIFIHGWGYNGSVCKKLLPIASNHNFRVVALYRRDYAPTTLLTDAELKPLGEGPEGQKQFMLERGLEIAYFIEKIIAQSNIPPTQADQRTGGVVLVGWSLGCSVADFLLSNVDSLSPSTLSTLSKYLHTVIYHDQYASGLGFDNPKEYKSVYHSDPKELLKLFKNRICAYFQHEDINSGDPKKLDLHALGPHKHSFEDMPEEEHDAMIDMYPYNGSDLRIDQLSSAVSRERTRRAFFDKDLAARLPNLRVRFYYGGQTFGITLWAMWQLEKVIEDSGASVLDGEKARDVKILHSETGNHFSFWDQPDDVLVHYRRCIEA